MALDRCIADIEKAAQGALSRADILEHLDDIERRFAKRARKSPLESKAQALKAIGEEMAQEAKIAAILEQRQRAINVLRKNERLERYAATPDKKLDVLDAMNVGSIKGFEGAADSVHSAGVALSGKLTQTMFGQLERGGLLKLFKDPDFEKQVFAEIWRITDPEKAADTGNKLAARAARIIAETTEAGRKLQNDAGAFIGQLPGYVMRQDHDMIRIRKAGLDGWKSDMVNWLDHDETFDGDADKFLNHVYDSLQTGKHEQLGGGDDWLMGYKGPGNLAKKASQGRKLHFKGPEEAFAYHQKYGRGSLLESVNHDLERAAKNTALMRTWGTNPEAAFNADLDQIAAQARDAGDTKTSDKARASYWRKAMFAQVNGTASMGGNPTVAAVGAFVRGWETLASLGSITASAITDIPVTAGTLRHSGMGYFEGALHQVRSLLEGRTTSEANEILEHLGIMMDGTVGDYGARFGTLEGPRGVMAKTTQGFFKWGGIRWWTDRMRAGVGLALSSNLAKLRGKVFSDLPERLKVNLTRYRIGEKEWDLVRQIKVEKARGSEFLTADAANRLSDDQIKTYLGKPHAKAAEVARARDEINTRLSIYFTDQVDEAINNPGAFERAVATGAQPAGTLLGEAVRAFMQFKTFGISMTRRHFGRELKRLPQMDKAGLAYLILGTTTMGYVAMAAKQMIAGKLPREPEDMTDVAALAGQAFAQGGGMGIYGDFLIGDFDRYGRGPIETLGGPLVGTLADTLKIISKTRTMIGEGKISDVPEKLDADMLRLVKQNLPFQNFIWTKTAVDHLIFYGMMEAASPGYLKRMKRRTEKENKQNYWLSPTSAVQF
jgi:hypothetical protein